MPEEIIPPERQLMDGKQSRLIIGIEDALGIVKAYIGFSMESSSGTQTGDSQYDATLKFLRKVLDSRPLEERAVAYAWLVTEKLKAKDRQEYEKADLLKKCQDELYPSRDDDRTQMRHEEMAIKIGRGYEDLTNNVVEGILRLANIPEEARIPPNLELRIKKYN